MSATLLPQPSSCVRFPIPGRNESWAIRRLPLLGVACTAMLCGYLTYGAIAERGELPHGLLQDLAFTRQTAPARRRTARAALAAGRGAPVPGD